MAEYIFAKEDRDAILAGLRLLQKYMGEMYGANPASQLGAIQDIFTNGGQHQGLDLDQIDSLCEHINS